MRELTFEVRQEDDGGFVAVCELAEGVIATQGDDWAELEAMVKDAVMGFFEGRLEQPEQIRLHLERDQILSLA